MVSAVTSRSKAASEGVFRVKLVAKRLLKRLTESNIKRDKVNLHQILFLKNNGENHRKPSAQRQKIMF